MEKHLDFKIDWRPHVALIRLNRPEKSNALPAASARQLIEYIQDAEDDGNVRCIVIRGSPSMFSGGADLDEISSDDPTVVLRLINIWTKVYLSIRMSMLPIVSVVEGPCVGGGYHMSLACDYTIATHKAWFRHTGVDVGISPMMPGTLMAPSVVGLKRASSLILRPRKVHAKEAVEIGICSEVVSEADLEKIVAQRVDELVGRDQMTVALAKAEINAGMGSALGASVLSQLAGFMHSMSPNAHKRIQAHRDSLGVK